MHRDKTSAPWCHHPSKQSAPLCPWWCSSVQMAAVRESSFMFCSEGDVEGYRETDVVKEHIRLSAVSWFFSSPISAYFIFEYTLLQQGSKAQNKFTKEIKRNTVISAQIEFTSQVKTQEPLSKFPPMLVSNYVANVFRCCLDSTFWNVHLRDAEDPNSGLIATVFPKKEQQTVCGTSATITYKPAASQRNRTLPPQGNTC